MAPSASAPARRATLERAVALPPAIGVLSRRRIQVRIEPAPWGTGLRFWREDIGREFIATPDMLAPSRQCTALGDTAGSVAFIEHIMAALWAAGISDARIVTNGPEIPLFEGSAWVFWEALQEAGRQLGEQRWPPLVLEQPLRVEEGEAWIEARPAPQALFHYMLDHPHPLIGRQEAIFGEGEDFGEALAPARTFTTVEEIQALYGIAPTAEIEELCLVIYEDRLSQQPTLPQAFARHKLLDLIGDLYLCGRRLQAHVSAYRSGHRLNHALAQQLARRAEGRAAE